MSSIVVANSNPDYAKKIASVLRSSGLYVGGVCTTGAQVMEFTSKHYHGGVVVCSVKLRDMPAVNLPRVAGASYDFLFLVSSQLASMSESLEQATLMLPINRMNLISTVNMFLNLSDYTSLNIKKKLAAGNLDEKQLIKNAKDLLIERNNFTEPQAHRFMQKKSMDTGKKMVETALIILNS
ncbi:ANTAR domain protein [Caprobacter fermentans]|uniref:ANTAR domain protein n=1 Tax=Caproicibacter fermentans TaxID=2576756 RepID=A0A6N8I2S0_9FIRM|nr:ANTAR domain-containing protein [Caproicibacter fermentans]MVB11950.1 ANTAR domain protein [Caproicibacter fermentans]OCM99823.1 ANTAR domain protein [Clostridium sp. W14A]